MRQGARPVWYTLMWCVHSGVQTNGMQHEGGTLRCGAVYSRQRLCGKYSLAAGRWSLVADRWLLLVDCLHPHQLLCPVHPGD